jgi:hypothetical protein
MDLPLGYTTQQAAKAAINQLLINGSAAAVQQMKSLAHNSDKRG